MSEVPAVVEALDRLAAAADRSVAEQVEDFEAVHRLLQDSLATLDGV